MKCREFKEWLLNHDISADRSDGMAGDMTDEMAAEVKTHLNHCSNCERLAVLDRRLDNVLHSFLQPVAAPRRLLERIELDLRSRENKQRKPYYSGMIRIVAPALATAVLMLIIFNPFNHPGIGSLDELGKFAFADHTNPMITEIKRGDKEILQGWFNNVMGIKITIPDLADLGYRLVGARKCKFGDCIAAHLLYDKNGDSVSLYILDQKDIHFKINPEQEYMLRSAGKTVRVWRKNHQVHALVI